MKNSLNIINGKSVGIRFLRHIAHAEAVASATVSLQMIKPADKVIREKNSMILPADAKRNERSFEMDFPKFSSKYVFKSSSSAYSVVKHYRI